MQAGFYGGRFEWEIEMKTITCRRCKKELAPDNTIHTCTVPMPRGTEELVCYDIAFRQAKGVAKYGMTVEQNPLTLKQWLQHAYEECLDQAVYLKRAIEEMDKTNKNKQ